MWINKESIWLRDKKANKEKDLIKAINILAITIIVLMLIFMIVTVL